MCRGFRPVSFFSSFLFFSLFLLFLTPHQRQCSFLSCCLVYSPDSNCWIRHYLHFVFSMGVPLWRPSVPEPSDSSQRAPKRYRLQDTVANPFVHSNHGSFSRSRSSIPSRRNNTSQPLTQSSRAFIAYMSRRRRRQWAQNQAAAASGISLPSVFSFNLDNLPTGNDDADNLAENSVDSNVGAATTTVTQRSADASSQSNRPARPYTPPVSQLPTSPPPPRRSSRSTGAVSSEALPDPSRQSSPSLDHPFFNLRTTPFSARNNDGGLQRRNAIHFFQRPGGLYRRDFVRSRRPVQDSGNSEASIDVVASGIDFPRDENSNPVNSFRLGLNSDEENDDEEEDDFIYRLPLQSMEPLSYDSATQSVNEEPARSFEMPQQHRERVASILDALLNEDTSLLENDNEDSDHDTTSNPVSRYMRSLAQLEARSNARLDAIRDEQNPRNNAPSISFLRSSQNLGDFAGQTFWDLYAMSRSRRLREANQEETAEAPTRPSYQETAAVTSVSAGTGTTTTVLTRVSPGSFGSTLTTDNSRFQRSQSLSSINTLIPRLIRDIGRAQVQPAHPEVPSSLPSQSQLADFSAATFTDDSTSQNPNSNNICVSSATPSAPDSPRSATSSVSSISVSSSASSLFSSGSMNPFIPPRVLPRRVQF